MYPPEIVANLGLVGMVPAMIVLAATAAIALALAVLVVRKSEA